MQKQGGNFLLQALLALTLVFAFMPFFANMASSRDIAAKMYSATEQIETAYTAARIYVREEKDNLPYKKIVLSKDMFVDTLESYGLPMGFVPQTIFKQDISLVIDKNQDGVFAYVDIKGGKLSRVQIAELARRIGAPLASTKRMVKSEAHNAGTQPTIATMHRRMPRSRCFFIKGLYLC